MENFPRAVNKLQSNYYKPTTRFESYGEEKRTLSGRHVCQRDHRIKIPCSFLITRGRQRITRQSEHAVDFFGYCYVIKHVCSDFLFFNQTNFTNGECIQSDIRKPPTVRVRPSCGACGVYGFTANTPWYIASTRTP